MIDLDLAAASLHTDNENLIKAGKRVPRVITIEEMKSLPKPSIDQQRRFVEYVSSAAPWCRLPIDSGGRFVVFLASDAGEHRPSGGYLPTAEEYRRQFGYLEFTVNGERKFYFGKNNRIAEEINQRFNFVLYPYVAQAWIGRVPRKFRKFQCPCLGNIDGDNIEHYIRFFRRRDHPELKRVNEFLNVKGELNEMYAGLSEEERQVVVRGIGVPASHLQSARQKYAKLEERREAILTDLGNREFVKIEEAVRRLNEFMNSH